MLEALFFTLCGIEVKSVPGFFLVVGWIVGTCIVFFVLSLLLDR